MLDHFTKSVRDLLLYSQREAMAFNHEYISPEHLLAAMARNGRTVAATLLMRHKLDWPAVRAEMEKRLKMGPKLEFAGNAVLSRSTRRVLRQARTEARDCGLEVAGTEHLLLGMLRDSDNLAAEVLTSRGITLEIMRADLIAIAEQPPSAEARAAAATEAGKRDQLANMFLSAMRESNALGYPLPQPAHVLMSLLTAEDPVIDRALIALNIDTTRLREELIRNLPKPG